jgi:trimethylamine---corrinoid protein Co-methyltransferase
MKPMSAQQPPVSRRARPSAREVRQKTRAAPPAAPPYITRTIPPYALLSEEGLQAIEHHADQLLEEIGLEIRGDREAIGLWRAAGARISGEWRVHVPAGLAREIVRRSAPREFTQHARNPARSVRIGGSHTVFAPAYGPPFVTDLARGRRYGTLEDFHNFVKLAYLSPWLHHSGGTVCEPVDVPVNKRHLDMVYAHMRYSESRSWAPSRALRALPTPSRCAGCCSVRSSSPITA